MVLVTGATGILGRVLVLELLKQGREVRATKRRSSNVDEVQNSYRYFTEQHQFFFSQIKWVDVDFEDVDSLNAALEGVSEVYHCAAHVSFHPNDRRSMYQINIEGTRQLLFACENSGVKKFCFVSSIAVLDGVDENGDVTEDSNYNPKLDHSPYARSKHFAEMEVWRASAEGLNVVILNPGVIIGSGNWQSSSGKMFQAFAKYPVAMSGSTAYVDVRDVANIGILLMNQNKFGERYIVISESKKIVEVANLVRSTLGLSPAKLLSKSLLNLGYGLNILLGWLFPALRMMSKVNVETVTSHPVISNRKIREALDYEFIPVFESIRFHLKNYITDYKKL